VLSIVFQIPDLVQIQDIGPISAVVSGGFRVGLGGAIAPQTLKLAPPIAPKHEDAP